MTNKMYHVTKLDNIQSIRSNGIIPGKTDGCCARGENDSVFLTTDYECLVSIDCDFSRGTIFAVFSVDVSGLELDRDDSYDIPEEYLEEGFTNDLAWKYKGEIPPSRVAMETLVIVEGVSVHKIKSIKIEELEEIDFGAPITIIR